MGDELTKLGYGAGITIYGPSDLADVIVALPETDLTPFISNTRRPPIKGTIISPHVNLRCPKCDTENRLELGEGEKEGVFPMTFYGTCPGCNHNLRVIATQEQR